MPLDREAIGETVKKTSKVIVLTKRHARAEWPESLRRSSKKMCLNIWTRPSFGDVDRHAVPYAPPLEEFFLPQVDDVVKAARDLAAY